MAPLFGGGRRLAGGGEPLLEAGDGARGGGIVRQLVDGLSDCVQPQVESDVRRDLTERVLEAWV